MSRTTKQTRFFYQILVGVDGRQGGRYAIAVARQLAGQGPKFTLAHVYGGPTAGFHAVTGRGIALQGAAAEFLLAQAARDAKIPAETAATFETSVGWGLHELANERDATLLVVGSCHRGRLGKTLLRDDTRRALNGAPCAVAVAHLGYATSATGAERLGRIGVGCNVSPESARALEVARALAARSGATVEALSVVSLQSIPYGDDIPWQWPKIASQLSLGDGQTLAELADVHGDITRGNPGEQLAAFSACGSRREARSTGSCRRVGSSIGGPRSSAEARDECAEDEAEDPPAPEG